MHILASEGAGDLARRAGVLQNSAVQDDTATAASATITVWQVSGAEAKVAVPTVIEPPVDVPPSHVALAGAISDAGAWPVKENGRFVAEVAGLEVARVVNGDPGSPDTPVFEVGVGQADRELTQMMHADAQNSAGLRRVVATVAKERTAGSHHPLARIARARWLRSVALAHPELVGAHQLDPLPLLRASDSVSNDDPVAAVGVSPDGTPLVVLFAGNADLDLAAEAADYRELHNPAAHVVVVSTPENAVFNQRGPALLTHARFETMPAPWLSP